MSFNFSSLYKTQLQLANTPSAIEWCAPSSQKPAVLKVDFDWLTLGQSVPQANGTREINYTVGVDISGQQGPLGGIRSVYIDNRYTPFEITVIADDTGHNVTCKPNTSGFFPLFTSGFTFTVARVRPLIQAYANDKFWSDFNDAYTTSIYFCNTTTPEGDFGYETGENNLTRSYGFTKDYNLNNTTTEGTGGWIIPVTVSPDEQHLRSQQRLKHLFVAAHVTYAGQNTGGIRGLGFNILLGNNISTAVVSLWSYYVAVGQETREMVLHNGPYEPWTFIPTGNVGMCFRLNGNSGGIAAYMSVRVVVTLEPHYDGRIDIRRPAPGRL